MQVEDTVTPLSPRCSIVIISILRVPRLTPDCEGERCVSSVTGSTQGCCLSPFCAFCALNSAQCNSAGWGFVAWWVKFLLLLNVSKTKVIDFRKLILEYQLPTVIGAADRDYEYLGIVLDHKLCFKPHVDSTSKENQQRRYFLRNIKAFHVSSDPLCLFHRGFIESVLAFCIIVLFAFCAAWSGNLNLGNKIHLSSHVKTSSKISRCWQNGLWPFLALREAGSTLVCPSLPLQSEIDLFSFVHRFRVPVGKTTRLQVSFFPTAIHPS